ncbi:hypothetical protein [Deinococcus ruber]|uniref:DUF4384 domain-containing protein n=1 Tax=Deinococcus ruber TaxID=1848197 RepID=A0A918CGU8_9DEIO|nr:hypothetical protein [Deinococcus ruber]GGR23500.1 hypothetical protein GCM10008957_39220 [Deinococcus ruber]
MKKLKLLLALVLLSPWSALADDASTLTLPAGAHAVVRPDTHDYSGPLQLSLKAGDQTCVSAGAATLTSGGVRRVLKAGSCYQLPAPRSLFSSLMGVASSWVPKTRAASTVGAESRAAVKCSVTPPNILLPRDYPLSTLRVPISYPPDPPTLRLYGPQNQVLYRAARGPSDASFSVPVALLNGARRLEVTDALGSVVYSGTVQWVDFPAGSATLNERARQLLDTGLIEYLLPAYTLLMQAGEAPAAQTLLDTVISVCYLN